MDPRPDLVSDTEIWEHALIVARRRDPRIFAMFVDFRAGGFRIETDTRGNLKFNFQEFLDHPYTEMTREELISDWLEPNRKAIREVLTTTKKEVEAF